MLVNGPGSTQVLTVGPPNRGMVRVACGEGSEYRGIVGLDAEVLEGPTEESIEALIAWGYIPESEWASSRKAVEGCHSNFPKLGGA